MRRIVESLVVFRFEGLLWPVCYEQIGWPTIWKDKAPTKWSTNCPSPRKTRSRAYLHWMVGGQSLAVRALVYRIMKVVRGSIIHECRCTQKGILSCKASEALIIKDKPYPELTKTYETFQFNIKCMMTLIVILLSIVKVVVCSQRSIVRILISNLKIRWV